MHYNKRGVSSPVAIVGVIVALIVGIGGTYAVTAGNTHVSTTTVTNTVTASSVATTTSLVTTTSTATTSTVVTSSSSSTKLTTVSIILDYTPYGDEHGWLYYGYDQGIFAQNGINLQIIPGSGSGAAVAAVAAGKATFGFADFSAFVATMASSNITGVEAVANIFPVNTYNVVYNTAVIHSISDLSGKTCTGFVGSGAVALFPDLESANGLSGVTIDDVSPATYLTIVATGQEPCTLATLDAPGVMAATAAVKNITLGSFLFADYGLNTYGHSLITTSSLVKSNSALVQAFVNASLYSVKLAALQEPTIVLASFDKYVTTFNDPSDQAVLLQGLNLYNKAEFSNITSSTIPLTLGYFSSQKVQFSINEALAAYNISPGAITASNLYTDQFVQAP